MALLAAAARLLAEGKTPSVTEVADAADVSRRNAYRYFPTQDQLLAEAALEQLRPVVTAALNGALPDRSGFLTDAAAAATRLDAVVRVLHRLTLEHEPLLRTIFRLTAGRGMPGEPSRGSRRLEWIAEAIDPVRPRLGKARFHRLVSALSLCVGADALFALRDMTGLSAPGVEAVTRWSAQALLQASLAEAEAKAAARTATGS
jgi:AcrR family transcriptional regulator